MNRSVARIDLFKSAKDQLAFQKTLRDAHARTPLEVFGYCVMIDHWHLVVRPGKDGDLSSFMQWLTLAHAQRWRAAHNSVGFGPLYQGRFKAFAVEDDHYFLTVMRYIERNPVRADVVDKAQNYKWSSLYARESGTPEDRAMLAKWPVDAPSDWINSVNSPQPAAEEEAIRLSIKRSRPYGKPAWQERTGKILGVQSSFRDVGRPKSKPTQRPL